MKKSLNVLPKIVVKEIRKLSDAILKLQSELAVSRQVNSLLSNRLTSIERQCWAKAQYSGRECLDVIGIPSKVNADVLEEKVLNNFGKLGCDILPERIDACHRVSKKSSTVIVKLTRRKDCQQVWSVKKDFQKINMEDVNLLGQNKLFINRSFCPSSVVQEQKFKMFRENYQFSHFRWYNQDQSQ